MRTQVEFKSDLFPAYPGEEEEINPGLWGKRLAEYLQAKLTEFGVETEGIWSEDWGWGLGIKHEPFKMWLGCGHQQDDDDCFLVFIEPSKPTVKLGLFKKIDATADIERVASALDRVLTSEPGIREVSWVQ